MRLFISLILAAGLAGCMTPAERTAQAQHEVEQMVQTYGPACEKLGFKPESDQWRNCVLQLDAKDNRDRHYPIMTSCFRSPGMLQCSTF